MPEYSSWCGTFVGHCLKVSGRYVVDDSYRALISWVKVGTKLPKLPKLPKIAYGSIAVLKRQGGGH